MADDIAKTLLTVASLGYCNVEFAGYFGHTAVEIRQLLSDAGLAAPSLHVSPGALIDHPESTLDNAALAGHSYVVLPWWEPQLQTPDGYQQLVDVLNHAGTLAHERGLAVAYHNHDFEFRAHADWVPFDFLLRQTESSLVAFELDIYWAVKAGRDPLQLFAAHPGRFPLLHAKDMASSGAETDIGNGKIDFTTLFRGLATDSCCHVFVERDEPRDPVQSAAKGLAGLQRSLEG